MKYFDTVPVASAMCVLKTGFLFTASEFGNQYVQNNYTYCTCHLFSPIQSELNYSVAGLPQVRKWSGKIKFFMVRKKSENCILSQGKLIHVL